MRAGTLRERIAIERAVTGADGYGNTVTGWTVHLSVWADFRETVGRERLAAGRAEAASTATVRIRSSDATRALTAADRIVARGVTWQIRGIVPVGNDRAMIDILCERLG